MKKFTTCFICFFLAHSLAAQQPLQLHNTSFTLHATQADTAILLQLEPMLRRGITEIELFFGRPFPAHVSIWLFAERKALDLQWQTDWGDSTFHSQCWMVASGTGKRLDVLSPRVWQTQACEHKATDTAALYQLLKHELVHVYHGQHCASRDFTGMDSMAWWVEGLATLVAGQLDSTRLDRVHSLQRQGKAPERLDQFWSGANRYGLAGSMVAVLESRYGREVLYELLPYITNEQLFKHLKTDEANMLKQWHQWLDIIKN